MYCPDDIVTLVNNSECDAFDPLCDYDGNDCCKEHPGMISLLEPTHTCQKFKNIHRAIYIPNLALK